MSHDIGMEGKMFLERGLRIKQLEAELAGERARFDWLWNYCASPAGRMWVAKDSNDILTEINETPRAAVDRHRTES